MTQSPGGKLHALTTREAREIFKCSEPTLEVAAYKGLALQIKCERRLRQLPQPEEELLCTALPSPPRPSVLRKRRRRHASRLREPQQAARLPAQQAHAARGERARGDVPGLGRRLGGLPPDRHARAASRQQHRDNAGEHQRLPPARKGDGEGARERRRRRRLRLRRRLAPWRRRRRRRRLWVRLRVGRGNDAEVADHGGARGFAAARLAPAGRGVQPGHGLGVGAPVGDAQRHAHGHRGRHPADIGSTGSMVQDDHLLLLALHLPELRHETREALLAPLEIGDHLEGLRCVDGERAPRPVGRVSQVLRVLAAAALVAIVVVTVGVWRVA
mmetsp:Transcript_8353/g.23205  ORF Transcript_8353/g.23205 Transcript_8353/m.23205 type:complete len:329 (+) Transcript_8353:118-1104(+)